MNDSEQKIKEQLLQDLISKMTEGMGSRMKPKAASVTVEAPDSAHLADGLDKAKDLLTSKSSPDSLPQSDEDRMAQLASDDDSSASDDDSEDDDKLAQLLESLHK